MWVRAYILKKLFNWDSDRFKKAIRDREVAYTWRFTEKGTVVYLYDAASVKKTA
jgi:hypothetical protein